MKGKMWRVFKRMYEFSKSSVLLDGKQSKAFSVEQGVAQGWSWSLIIFSVIINELLSKVEQAGLGIELNGGCKIGSLLFADGFVGVTDSEGKLQELINVVHTYCRELRLKANVIKSAVMVFARDPVVKWGDRDLPTVTKYTYLGVEFTSNGAYINKVLESDRKKVNQLHSVISNRDINVSARRMLLLSVV